MLAFSFITHTAKRNVWQARWCIDRGLDSEKPAIHSTEFDSTPSRINLDGAEPVSLQYSVMKRKEAQTGTQAISNILNM
ncbi:hypothetical protein [Burkholderia sp. TSV86]|uniref:hypothetical protein n=1 Tax=Burkholderia sp. TSV86 TaxID=1385594 RepID=UPI0018D20DD8|nr:hypothetical protein [Burkholderia sp. TSV86]